MTSSVGTERVEDVFKAAPGNQKVLMTTLEACRTPRTPSELDEIMGEVLRCNRSVFRPVELRALLERYGAIVYEPSDEERALMQAREAGEELEIPVDEEGNLLVVEPTEGVWSLTEAGAAFLDADPVGTQMEALLKKDAVYLPVYRALLELVEDHPCEKAVIDRAIDPHPLVQRPRLFAGYFLGELERIDALEWSDAWCITPRGRTLLDALRACEEADDNNGLHTEETY